jgi:hypothetical protein
MAFQATGSGLIAWPVGDDSLRVRSVTHDTLGAPVDVDLDQATGLQLLEPAGQRFLAVATGERCTGQGGACVRARGFDASGTPTGPVYAPDVAGQDATITAHTRLDDGIAIAQPSGNDARMDLYRLGTAGEVVVEPHPQRNDCSGEARIGALATDHGTIVALGGSSCSSPPNFLLSQGGARLPVRGLPGRARVVYFASDGGTSTVVYGAGRPRVLRLRNLDGSVREAATTLTTHDTMPGDLQTVVRTQARVVRGKLTLFRTDLAGNPLGESIMLAPVSGRVVTEIVQTGWHFDVLWWTRSGHTWQLYMQRLNCVLERASNPRRIYAR